MPNSFILKVPGNVGPPPSPTPTEPTVYPRCEHPRLDVRKKLQSNGVWVAARQCVTCGGHCGAVKKASIPSVTGLPPWDTKLAEAWRERVSAEFSRRVEEKRQAESRGWWDWYNAYLASPAWHTKRDAILRRDNYLCRGCGVNRATQVHHLDYKRVGKEMLFDLVSICGTCHDLIHDKDA